MHIKNFLCWPNYWCKYLILDLIASCIFHDLNTLAKPGLEVIKTFFMLNSVEHVILNAHEYKSIKKFDFLAQISLECYFPRS